jgi:hypothetical protein
MPKSIPAVTWPDVVVLDPAVCEPKSYFAALPLGSSWARVEPTTTACQLWVGGETEDPRYEGFAYAVLLVRADLYPSPPLKLLAGGPGGPPHLTLPACTP